MTAPTSSTTRCAVYTRKSTEENLNLEFNSLDAQRDAGEAYITSQKAEGWMCLPDRYDDGGFTGGNIERPALKRLMAEIEDGKVDAVVVYKVDRLSRSLLDFARLLEVFEKHNVAFISVTQQINSANSMGRLMMNVLLSFAQFEREIISERTRDKIAAARRKGKYAGGKPILGYDLHSDGRGARLVVNDDEAEQVRGIFRLYVEKQSIAAVICELDARKWGTKQWTTRGGRTIGGRPFSRPSLHSLLTNVTYLGKVRHRHEVFEGEHDGIIDPAVYEQVQALMQRNAASGGAQLRNRHGATLRGLLYCGACGSAMTHTYTSRGTRRYRYYRCAAVQKRSAHACSIGSIPAHEVEQFIAEQIRTIGRESELITRVTEEASRQQRETIAELEAEQRTLAREAKRLQADIRRRAGSSSVAESATRLATIEERGTEIERQLTDLRLELVTEEEVAQALAEFDAVWARLSPGEQAEALRAMLERVEYDGKSVRITFRAGGLKSQADDESQQEDAA